MTLGTLDEKLNCSLMDFSEEIRSNYSESSKTPITEADLIELSRQTFYTLDEFRKNIIEYLKTN